MQPRRTKLTRRLAAGLLVVGAASIALGYSFIVNDQDPAPNGTRLPIKWAPGPIVMKVMADNTNKLSDGNTQAQAIVVAMTDATRGWNQYLGNVQFAPTIMPAASGADGNGINEVFFSNKPYNQSWDKNTLAVTTVWFAGNERGEADTIFNTAFTWDSYRGPLMGGSNAPVDIVRVALHEFGHNLGLDHPDDAGEAVSADMNSTVSNIDSLQPDDIQGAQRLYGPPGAPANDSFSNAINLVLNNNLIKVTGYSTNATKEAGEPNHAGNNGGRSVWWKWTAPGAGSVTVNTGSLNSSGLIDLPSSDNTMDTTYDNSSTFDTTLGVYTGSSVSNLTTVASNDDIKDGVIQVSSLTFTATAGTTYYFAVDGYNDPQESYGADSGGVTLNVAFSPIGGTLPTITTQPLNQAATAGDNISFTVTATAGTSTISYQWMFNGTAISGATNATLTLNGVTSTSAGTYTVVVSTAAGTVTSSPATLTVKAAVVTPPVTMPTSSGGGGGGGAPSLWFLVALSLLAASRWRKVAPASSR